MGAYYAIFNHSKREFIAPFTLGLDEKYMSITGEPVSQLIIHQLVNGSAYIENISGLIGNWCGDEIEIIPDDNIQNTELRENLERLYQDVSKKSAKQLRSFDSSWAVVYTDNGEEIDLITW